MPTPKHPRPRLDDEPFLSVPDSAPPRSRLPSPGRASGFFAFLLEVVKVVVFALAIIVPVRYFLVQPFYVKGASMEPNFEDRQYLLIDEISYRFREPRRGEVVVLRNPNQPSEFFIKRVIGLPGDRVEVIDGHVRIADTDHPSGFVLDESAYLASTVTTTGGAHFEVGPSQYVLFGDNRPASLDSRVFGPVARSRIVGRVWVRALPFDRFTIYRATSLLPAIGNTESAP